MRKETVSPYRLIPLNDLVESPNNPRKRFNQKSLEELAESIVEHGILTPILARPLDDVAFEIAAGHRRYRAAQIAGLQRVPIIVREMTDQQFMEVLTVENLQREDVHAFEEAQGYAELMKLPGYDVGAVAGKIGRGEGYVRSRLKLLGLIPEVADEFLNNGITFAHARLIAPLGPEKQAEALGQCFATFGRNGDKRELLPPSELREFIRDGQGEDLADAPFSLDDAGLVPEAGACLTCPKSTCADGRLFGDEQGGETCYDKKCFENKLDAHVAALAKSGLIAINVGYQPKEFKAGALIPKEFTEIRELPPSEPDDDPDYEPDPEGQSCAFTQAAVIVSGHLKGQTRMICRNEKCPIHGKQQAVAAAAASGASRQMDHERKAKDVQRKAEWENRRQTVELICQEWNPSIDRTLAFLLVLNELNSLYSNEDAFKLSKPHGLSIEKDLEAQKGVLYTWAEQADQVELASLLKDLLFESQVERSEYSRGYDLIQIAADELKDRLTPAKKAAPAKKPAKKK